MNSRTRNGLMGMVLAGVVALGANCDSGSNSTHGRPLEEISGIPVSVNGQGDRFRAFLAIVLKQGEKYVLAGRNDVRETASPGQKGYVSGTENLARAVALVQAEIDDGDNELIKLRGYRDDTGYFTIETIEANGYVFGLGLLPK